MNDICDFLEMIKILVMRFSKSHLVLVLGIFILPVFVFSLFPLDTSAQVTWCDTAWSNRKTITISSTNVDSDLTDFSLLLNITDSNLASTAKSDATDIFFVEEANCTKLAWEKESYTSGTGALVAWVKVPTVDADASTVLYMYYGNASAADQTDATNVWDANFKGVWHMAEDPSVSTDGDCGGGTKEVCDSTSNNYDGDSGGTMTSGDQVAGQIGNGIDFDGSDDYLDMGDPTTDDLGLEFASGDNLVTIEAWINPRSSGGGTQGRIVYKTNQVANLGYMVRMQGTSGNEAFNLNTNDGAGIASSAASIPTSDWTYVVATHNVTTGELFIDGASVTSGSTGDISENGISFTIGNNDASITQNRGFDGIIDEVRVSDVVRADAWIKFSYHNQFGTSGTITLGSQEAQAKPKGRSNYNAPPLPPAGSGGQEGEFKVIINPSTSSGQANITNSPWVTLTFVKGPDTTKLAVSNLPDLSDASIERYQDSKQWHLCIPAQQQSNPQEDCPEGTYKVYARFYTEYLTRSDVVQATIEYKKEVVQAEETPPPQEQPAQSSESIEAGPPQFEDLGGQDEIIKAELQERINQLKTLVQQLFDQLNHMQTEQGTLTSLFVKPLRFGMQDPDVQKLQQLLNQQGFLVASTGPGSLGQETDYFGLLTLQAVQKLQLHWRITIPEDPAFGYVGPKTRERLNELGK